MHTLFLEEATTRLHALSDLVIALESEGPHPELIHSIFREAHTLKGSAAVVGLEDVAREAHVLESLMDRIRSGSWEVTPEVVDTILGSVDQLFGLTSVERPPSFDTPGDAEPATVAATKPAPAPAPKKPEPKKAEPAAASGGGGGLGLSGLLDDEPVDDEPVDEDAVDEDDEIEIAVAARPSDPREAISPVTGGTNGSAAAVRRQDTARVAVERLDDLVRVAGESASAHLRLARVLQERVGEDSAIATEMRALTRLLTELHDKTLRARMLPIGTLSGQLRRAVRDLARATGKKVRIEIRGEDTELDRSVHEKLADVLPHLVRNAVDHGIETPEARRAAGKTEDGHVVVHAMQLGSRVIVTVSDDGRGVDTAAVRAQARERLNIDTSRFDDDQVNQLLFHPGFSTAEVVTDVSGHGVGLDAVKEMIEGLRGRIEVTSHAGKGMSFRIGVPITLAVLQGLTVQAAGNRFAVGMHSVTSVLSRDTPEIMVEGRPAIRIGEQVIPLRHLASVLNMGEGTKGEIIVVTGLTRTHAFRVDALGGQRELVVKGLPDLVPPHDAVVGGSPEPDGTVMFVLDADGLIETAAGRDALGVRLDINDRPASDTVAGGPAAPGERRTRAGILVVDDALTVRELQRSILERAGYDVRIAIDGADALDRLREGGIDLVLTDVEMPTMDGLTLTRNIRAKSQWQNLPVVILTTRSAAEDRQAGMEAGADAYILKSSFTEAALLDVVTGLLGTEVA